MIKVTRLNDTQIVINAELIEFVEETPDTVITMTTGRKIVVKETIDEIIGTVIQYKRKIYSRIDHLAE
ncbi:MAG: flagellar protein FlbD [Epulopiscium sp.]|jgi:flagellar protein FlbD|uniref:Endoflagellar protein n=1 Tax=Defluviitalea raffinosedens TaxID=1450156 RepID=A0A7C8LMC1_9FIRM|nr:flagellar FlbD family protein [Defluviitalea raffinosedens]KAE9637043.1 endoflagellar protein [Defluviitalea raffinosedens]MBM7685201.1 flagellar protein FlbD [Defluviitalea raffinosedens]MBZ4669152.1 FlgEa [Defluviitaleaceae bacterium]MDK2787153.1 flagellar protein FlbD [Candidatus Epulonipiscium sp.]